MEETYGPNFTFKTLSSLHPPHSSTHKGKAMCPDTWSYVHWNIVPLAMPNCTWYPNLRSRNTLLSLQQVNHSNSNWKTGICIIITLSVIQMQKRQCYVPGHLVLTPECIEMLYLSSILRHIVVHWIIITQIHIWKLDCVLLLLFKQLGSCFCQIERSKGKGPKFTDLGGKHLYGRKGAQPRASILGSLSRSLAHWWQPKKYDV